MERNDKKPQFAFRIGEKPIIFHEVGDRFPLTDRKESHKSIFPSGLFSPGSIVNCTVHDVETMAAANIISALVIS